MFHRPCVLLAVLVALAVPQAAGDVGPVEAAKPLAAVAFQSGSSVFVAWAPGPEQADAYFVYGIQNGSRAFLGSAPAGAWNAEVAKGYPAYAVTALKDGIESAATLVLTLTGLCVGVEPGNPPDDLPGVVVGCQGGAGVRLVLQAELP